MTKKYTEKRLEQMLAKLQEKHFRLTPQRMEVVKILAGSTEHLSVDDIHARVHKQFPTTSLATTYKTVSLLRDVGEVIELGFAEGGNRYDGYRPYPHPHLICSECKKILDPELPMLDIMSDEVARQTGFELTTHRLDFFGVCPDCQQKKAS